ARSNKEGQGKTGYRYSSHNTLQCRWIKVELHADGFRLSSKAPFWYRRSPIMTPKVQNTVLVPAAVLAIAYLCLTRLPGYPIRDTPYSAGQSDTPPPVGPVGHRCSSPTLCYNNSTTSPVTADPTPHHTKTNKDDPVRDIRRKSNYHVFGPKSGAMLPRKMHDRNQPTSPRPNCRMQYQTPCRDYRHQTRSLSSFPQLRLTPRHEARNARIYTTCIIPTVKNHPSVILNPTCLPGSECGNRSGKKDPGILPDDNEETRMEEALCNPPR
ncbi:hypothetical protein B0H66DRAFT_624611, partial [Apodospora peruviana]